MDSSFEIYVHQEVLEMKTVEQYAPVACKVQGGDGTGKGFSQITSGDIALIHQGHPMEVVLGACNIHGNTTEKQLRGYITKAEFTDDSFTEFMLTMERTTLGLHGSGKITLLYNVRTQTGKADLKI